MPGETTCGIVLDQGRNLVAEAEHAARLEPDHGDAAIDEPLDRCEYPLGFAARFIEFADGEKRAATAERPGAVTRRCDMYPIARRPQHAERRIEILALEIPIERVGEHDNFLAALPDLVPGVDVSIVWIAKPIRAPARQTSPRTESGRRLGQL